MLRIFLYFLKNNYVLATPVIVFFQGGVISFLIFHYFATG